MMHDHGAGRGLGGMSRRRVLAALAAAGAGQLLPQRLEAQPAPAARHLIDTHHHYYPPEIIGAWQDYATRHHQGPLGQAVAHWTPKSSLDEMDKSGVAISILSLALIPGV